MSRYYFHVTTDQEIRDTEGTDLATLAAARCHAVKIIADALCASPELYWEHERHQVTATDATNLTLFTVEMISNDAAAVGLSR